MVLIAVALPDVDLFGQRLLVPDAAIQTRRRQHAYAADHGYWNDDGARSRTPADLQRFFDAARTGIAPYAGKTRLLSHLDEEVVPGLTAIPLPGHTPGHPGYRVSSGPEELLIWGDIVHASALQFARPETSFALDVGMDVATATRLRTMDMAAADRVLIAGMHLDFPAFGHVQVGTETRSYRFVPLPWQATFGGSEP